MAARGQLTAPTVPAALCRGGRSGRICRDAGIQGLACCVPRRAAAHAGLGGCAARTCMLSSSSAQAATCPQLRWRSSAANHVRSIIFAFCECGGRACKQIRTQPAGVESGMRGAHGAGKQGIPCWQEAGRHQAHDKPARLPRAHHDVPQQCSRNQRRPRPSIERWPPARQPEQQADVRALRPTRHGAASEGAGRACQQAASQLECAICTLTAPCLLAYWQHPLGGQKLLSLRDARGPAG